jgi:phage regulator Rha-like protein
MTSLEIAELTGKQHKNVMQAIRNMEPAWEKTCGLKFQLTSRTIVQPNGGTREVPCYSLTKTECLYIATKFNDEARARLVLRWEELERRSLTPNPKGEGRSLTPNPSPTGEGGLLFHHRRLPSPVGEGSGVRPVRPL